MKKVYTARNLADAHLLKGLLESVGIIAGVQGEQAFQIAGQNPSKFTALTVWILNDDDFEKAIDLVSSYREGNGKIFIEESPWRCSCGEENEGQFTECWNCGKAKPNFEKDGS